MSTDQQLKLIAEVIDVARDLDVAVWLRGGWAVDFFLRRVTRSHRDIDFFAWSRDADRLVAALADRGFTPLTVRPADQQRDLAKDGEEVSFALLGLDDDGRLVVGGGPWAGVAFPEATRHEAEGRIDDLECPIVSPEGQIRIKLMTPIWMPGRPRRTKDTLDIALLRAAITDAGES